MGTTSVSHWKCHYYNCTMNILTIVLSFSHWLYFWSVKRSYIIWFYPVAMIFNQSQFTAGHLKGVNAFCLLSWLHCLSRWKIPSCVWLWIAQKYSLMSHTAASSQVAHVALFQEQCTRELSLKLCTLIGKQDGVLKTLFSHHDRWIQLWTDLLNFSLWHPEREFCTYKDTSNLNFSLKIGSEVDNWIYSKWN